MSRKNTGILGERLAAEFLRERGYHVLETNYRCPEGEIDIVAQHGDSLVFIEVRTKQSKQFGTPEESITPVKKERLRQVAARYREAHDDLPEQWRIDVVVVELSRGKPTRIELIENAVGGE
jgi:putative endonuclease